MPCICWAPIMIVCLKLGNVYNMIKIFDELNSSKVQVPVATEMPTKTAVEVDVEVVVVVVIVVGSRSRTEK